MFPGDFSIKRDIWGDLMGSSLCPGLPFLATLKRMDVMHLDLYSVDEWGISSQNAKRLVSICGLLIALWPYDFTTICSI